MVVSNQHGDAVAGPETATPEGEAQEEPPPEPDDPDPDPDRAPSSPRNLNLTPGDEQIAVSWDAPADLGKPEADGYIVEYREAGSRSWQEEGWFTGTEAVIEWLENGTEYEVRVVVSNQHGDAVAGPKRATPRAQ